MPCYSTRDRQGNRKGFICGNLGPHCVDCGAVADVLCDFPVGKGKTCDRTICEHCAHLVAENTDYCEQHARIWREFKESGSLEKELKKVVPFKNVIRF